MLRASAEIEVANELSAVTERAQRTALLESADRRLAEAASYFAAHDEALDAANAVNLRGVRALSAGDEEQALALFSSARDQAAANADPGLSIKALNNLAWLSNRRGEIARAAREYEALLPLLEGDRDGDAYATAIGNYGLCLVALGEFDRALAMHSEALEVFRARGAEADRGRELNALGGLYMRVGELERALETLRAASAVNGGIGAAMARASSLRMAGNTAAALGDPRLALRYLRESLEQDATPQNVASTRVLMAAQLRMLGDLAGAAREIDAALAVDNDLTRAHALAERGQLRRRQRDYQAALVRPAHRGPAVRVTGTRLRPHRYQRGLVADIAGDQRRPWRRGGRRHRDLDRAADSREVRQSGVARAFPGGALFAVRGAYRRGAGGQPAARGDVECAAHLRSGARTFAGGAAGESRVRPGGEPTIRPATPCARS